ncbi:hypothetical protein PENSPDRAFT_264487 [Peniophora sp. CONT]|nr:hypothetical protein PENSPDRAFT_264487 [Peniophora sp. CONT]
MRACKLITVFFFFHECVHCHQGHHSPPQHYSRNPDTTVTVISSYTSALAFARRLSPTALPSSMFDPNPMPLPHQYPEDRLQPWFSWIFDRVTYYKRLRTAQHDEQFKNMHSALVVEWRFVAMIVSVHTSTTVPI